MPKSLCLGWSCETGPSRNITTVMVFQNSTQIITLQHLLRQAYMLCSLCRHIYNCTMKLRFPSYIQFLFILPFVLFPSMSLFALCLSDGAAMRAGVQTGDRIIKVLCSSAPLSVNCKDHCLLV